MSFLVTDTYNVPRFSSIAGPFDLGRKHIRKKLQKEAKDIKPLTVHGDWIKDLSQLRQSKGEPIAHRDSDVYLYLFKN